MFFYLKVSAKNKTVLKNFIKFLAKLETSLVTIKNFPKQSKRKFFTILKSPHVNKTAQEQFEFRFYSKCFLISSFNPFLFFSFLKKVKSLSFSGIKLEVQSSTNDKGYYKAILKAINPDIISLSQNSENVFRKKYFQLFDCYGEICLKNLFYLKKK